MMEYSRIKQFIRLLSEPDDVGDAVSKQSVPVSILKVIDQEPEVTMKASGKDGLDTRDIICTEPPEVKNKTYSMNEVSYHSDYSSCWVVIMDKVYDITDFIREHPGGEDIILENAGRDVTVPFSDVGHSKDALLMLEKYCIGMLVEKDRIIPRKRRDTV